MNKVKCLNCGCQLKTEPFRFVVCDCGHTEPCMPSVESFIFYYSDKLIGVSSPTGDYELSDTNQILEALRNKPVKNAWRVITDIANDEKCPDKKSFLLNLPAWAVISHMFQFINSSGYQRVFQKKAFDVLRDILNSGKIFPANVSDETIESLVSIFPTINAGGAMNAIEALSNGYSSECAALMANTQVDSSLVLQLANNTDFSEDELFEFIEDFGQDGFIGEELVAKIIEYNSAINELRNNYGIECKEMLNVNSASVSLFIAQNLCRANSLIGKKTKRELEKHYLKSREIGAFSTMSGYSIRPAPAADASRYSHVFPQTDRVVCMPVNIYRRNKKIGMLYIGEKDFYLAGETNDEVKAALNEWLQATGFDGSTAL